MMIEKIETSKAPSAVGPYSQGIKAHGLIFLSGQTPIDMATGKLCTGTVGEQAHCSLMNLSAVAEAAGTSLDNVVKTTVFLTDMNDFAEFNAEYAKFFPNMKPARSCIAVKTLPLGARLEIEAICAE